MAASAASAAGVRDAGSSMAAAAVAGPVPASTAAAATGAAAASSAARASTRRALAEANARRARHADYGQCWGEGAARCFSIEGDFLDEDQGVRLMPVPDSFICPISLSIMVDPVAAVDGTVYERDYIERWIRQQRQERKAIISPVTGLELHSTTLMPLAALQRAIETYLAARPELRQVPTEGRSFEEAAQVLQSDLIEKEHRHEDAQEEVKRLLAKNEDLQRSLRKSEEKYSVLMDEFEHTRAELHQALLRLRAWEGGDDSARRGLPVQSSLSLLETSVHTGSCATAGATTGTSRSSSSSSSVRWGKVSDLAGSTASAVSAALASSQPSSREAADLVRQRGGRAAGVSTKAEDGRPEVIPMRRRRPDERTVTPLGASLKMTASRAKAYIVKMARHPWTLPFIIVAATFASYVVVQLDLYHRMAQPSSSERVVQDATLQESPVNLGVCLSCSQVSPLGNSTPSKRDKKARKEKARDKAHLGDRAWWQDDEDRARAGSGALLGDLSIERQVELLQDGTIDDKRSVAFSLWNMAVGNSQAQVAIARAGAIVPLVGLLQDAESEVKEAAAAVLGSIAEHSQYRATIAKAGAIKPLTLILEDAREGTRVVAARALWGLTTGNTANQAAIARAGAIPLLVGLLSDTVARVRVAAGAALCGLAIDHQNNQVAIAKAGAIEPLVSMLREEEAGARVTAAAALRNLAIANLENQAAVVAAGAIKPLVDLLWDTKAAAQEDAAFMLANLAANNANHRTWIARAGAIAPLIELLNSRAPDLQEAASMVLRNLAGDNKVNAQQIVEAGAIAPLVKVVGAGAPRVRKQAAWGLWNLATASSENLAAVVRARAVAPIVKELGDTPAAREEIHATLLRLAADYREPDGG